MRHLSTAALLTFAVGCGMVVQYPQWAQTSYYLLTRALADGTSRIDAHQWQTGDKSWINGHFYSVKAPGMPALLVPPYLVLHAIDFESASKSFARKDHRPLPASTAAHRGDGPTAPRTRAVSLQIRRERLMIWALGLFGCVLPALLLLFLVRADAERLVPGTGTAVALMLGIATMILPFATQLFGHVMGAFLLYGGFHLLMRERRGPPRPVLLLLAGLIVGLAVVVEYPMAFGGMVIGIYAMLRTDGGAVKAASVLKRGATYAGGVIVGLIPLAVYNQVSFGSVTTMSYKSAVAVEGRSGHAKLGLNDGGFFGIGIPKPINFIDILLSPRGLLSVTPICLIGFLGLLWMRSEGHRSEALAALGVVGIYIFYVSGYWLPFGGLAPGPRFLVAMLPFLALGFAFALKRLPAATLALAGIGGTVMVAATLAGPLVAPHAVLTWWSRFSTGKGMATFLTVIGVPSGGASIIPVILIFVASAGMGLFVTRLPQLGLGRDLPLAGAALGGWLLLGLVVSPAIGERKIIKGQPAVGLPWQLVLVAALVGCLSVAAALAARRFVISGSATDPAGQTA